MRFNVQEWRNKGPYKDSYTQMYAYSNSLNVFEYYCQYKVLNIRDN